MGNSESAPPQVQYGTGASLHNSPDGRGNSIINASSTRPAQAVQAPTPPPISPPTQAPGGPPGAPGAYKMPGQPRQQRFYVTIPRGVRPGQHFAVLVNGQQMMVRCPEGNKPGERLIVTAPRLDTQQFVVTVPANVRPGQQFRVMINNQEVMVTCPRGVRSGQRVTFTLPRQEPPPRAAPNHQMFEVAVPDGVRPGQPFALIANGQRVMVTCPPNVRPGQKIRFQLPIQLSEQQLNTIKVSYDKDGWMRCLGPDLKFHWCYNVSNSDMSTRTTHLIPYDIEGTAYVRQLIPNPISPANMDLTFIPATEYSIETSVKGTNVNYEELNKIAQQPFQQKVEWLKAQFSLIRIPWEEGHIKIRVRRQTLLQDSMDAWESIDVDDMKKIFRFEFSNEPGLDAGGVAREFYGLLCEQLFNPDCGLFLSSTVNQMCMQINPNSGIANEFHLRYFHMVGRLLGKALMDNQITPVHLVQPLYKHIMGWPVSFRDLEQIDDQIYRNLLGMLDMDDVSILGMDFTTTEDQLGVVATIELIPNGSNIEVDNNNCAMYLDAQLKYRLMDRIKSQLAEVLKGFYDVVPEPLLSVFDFQEIELLLHGLPNIDMEDWIKNTEYTGEFTNQPSHKVLQWFWEVVRSFEQDQKAKFLQFVTGTSGVPVQGFGYLQGNDGNIRKFTINGDKNVKVFPRAHTCFNRIDMPMYKSKTELQKYLTMAISIESTGFGLE
jgi:E3 ubiquitin-protein ligase NEDD4